MVKESDPRVTWNKFVSLLQETVEAWEEHREAMFANRTVAELDLNSKELLYDFWRSTFDKMIDRFVAFYIGIGSFKNLVVEIPKPEKKEGGK